MALAIALSVAPAAVAEHYEGTVELQGATPVEAAVSFSRAAFPDGALEAALGRDDNFADSLASGVLQNNAPLLLTPTASLAPATSSELKRLGVKTVHILGGHAAVSPAVEQQLVASGYAVRRHRGATRIDTAVEIARAIVPSASEVLIARAFGSGEDATQAFADSLAAGAWSASSGSPVLLTETEKLSTSTQTYLQSNKPTRAYVVGGTSAVSDVVLTQIRALGIEAERVSGPTRFDTAIEINKRRGISGVTDTDEVVLLEGQAAGAWAPGFASAAYAAVERAPVLLASGTTLPAPTSAYLDAGTRELALLCAPQLAAEACDAAAKLLEKRIAPQVKLNEAEVPQYGDVTGTATPTEEIVSMTASGCGLTDAPVTVQTNGSFSVEIEGAPGTCTLALTVKTRTLGDHVKSFALTVTDPAPATLAPELVKVETATTGAATTTVRFVFSEIIRGTTYQGTGATETAQDFLLYSPRGGTPAGRYEGETAAGLLPRRDPENNHAVLVDFDTAKYQRATTAAVTTGAAVDLDGGPSVPGSAPLKTAQLEGARTEGDFGDNPVPTARPDLVSVGSINTQDQPAGRFQASFTFDTAFTTTPAKELFGLVLDDGRVIPANQVTGSGPSYTLTFAVAETRTPEGVTCADPGCPTVQQAMTGARRGYLEGDDTAGSERPLQTVNVTTDGSTTRADLVSVALDVAGGKADLTFDQAVTTADASKFTLYTVGRELLPIESATVSGSVVSLKAPVSKLVVGVSAAAGAVTAANGQNAPTSVGVTQSFAAGEVVAPALTGGTAVLTDSNTQTKTWQITWTFDRAITLPDSTGLVLYDSKGLKSVFTGCTVFEERSARCSIPFSGTERDKEPALLSVERDAVTVPGSLEGQVLMNIEKSVRL